jgi:LysM repeat protein
MNYNLTPEQLKEIENRIGTSDLRRTQFNIMLRDGTIIPAGINPGQAATIQLGGGAFDRSTTEGQQIASQFPATTVNPQQELAKAQAETPVIGGTQPLGQPFGQFTTAGEQPAQPAPQTPKPFGDFTYGPDQPAQPNQDLSQQLNQMMTTLQGMQQQATGQTGGGVYTVQSGDTLSAIAAKNGMSLQQLLQNNPQFQANPNLIIPGQQVNLGGQVVTQQPVSHTPTQPPAKTITNSADTKVQNSLQAITTGDPTKSLTDIVKELSISMGLPDITNQIQELDNKMTQEIADINLNPWISNAEVSKRTALTQQKYESRKSALIDRLKLQNDVVRQAVDYYERERAYQQTAMLTNIKLAQEELDRKERQGALRTETIGGFTVLRDASGNIISTIKEDTGVTTIGGTSENDVLVNAVLNNPSLYNDLTSTVKGKIAGQLAEAGFSGFGKMLSDAAIKEITQTKGAITELEFLKQLIENNQDKIGPIVGLEALNPYSEKRKIQADIDRIRQTVGKALEGGVLRKEDEEKYKKILATITDTPSTALYKLDSLINSLSRDISTYTELQGVSGRNVGGVVVPTTSNLRNTYGY